MRVVEYGEWSKLGIVSSSRRGVLDWDTARMQVRCRWLMDTDDAASTTNRVLTNDLAFPGVARTCRDAGCHEEWAEQTARKKDIHIPMLSDYGLIN